MSDLLGTSIPNVNSALQPGPLLLHALQTRNGRDRLTMRCQHEHVLPDNQWLMLLVETEKGLLLRNVPSASPLPEGDTGAAAEKATKHVAMYWGLPDFVFPSAVRTRGRGVRELGDVIVCVGDLAAIVQVKARTTISADPTREANWLAKKIPQAISQAKGTLRSFARRERDTLVNERGNRVELIYGAKSWALVVIIDHPAAAGLLPEPGAVVLWRRDWEFLFEQLKSTYAVISYLHHVQDLKPVPLGGEPMRYYQLAAKPAIPRPPTDVTGLGSNPVHTTMPLLPQIPASEDSDDHLFLQQILAAIAASPRSDNVAEGEFLDVLAAIDTMAVGHRTEFGRLLASWLSEVVQTPAGHFFWRSRRYLGATTPHLIFAAGSSDSVELREAFSWFVRLRHQQLIEARPDRRGVMTAGIILTPRHASWRPWDAALYATREEQEFPSNIRAALEKTWPLTDELVLLNEDSVSD